MENLTKQVTLNDLIFSEKMIVPAGIMQEPTRIEVGECRNQQDYKIDKGERTDSKFMCVKPFHEFAAGKKVTIQMKVKSSGADVYHSSDSETWEKVDNVEYDDGVVRFKYGRGKMISIFTY